MRVVRLGDEGQTVSASPHGHFGIGLVWSLGLGLVLGSLAVLPLPLLVLAVLLCWSFSLQCAGKVLQPCAACASLQTLTTNLGGVELSQNYARPVRCYCAQPCLLVGRYSLLLYPRPEYLLDSTPMGAAPARLSHRATSQLVVTRVPILPNLPSSSLAQDPNNGPFRLNADAHRSLAAEPCPMIE